MKISILKSRSLNFEKVEILIEREVDEKEFTNAFAKMNTFIDKQLDVEEVKMIDRAQKRDEEKERSARERQEKEELLKAMMPKTPEEAVEVELEDGTKLGNIGILDLPKIAQKFDFDTPQGRGARILLGKTAEGKKKNKNRSLRVKIWIHY